MADRKKNEDELNEIVEAWTRERDRDWMVDELCRAGLAAAPSRDARDLYADPHLRDREAFVRIDHPELGELEMVRPPWKIPGRELPTSPAPLLGEHNQYVLGELLGLNDREIEALRKKDVIG